MTEVVAYFFVSAFSFVLDLGVFSFSMRTLGFSWFFAALFGFFFGLLSNYFLSVKFVFSKRRLRRVPRKEFFIFSLLGFVSLFLTQIVLWLGIECLLLNPEFCKIVAAALGFFLNFVLRKFVLFQNDFEKALSQ